MDVTKLAKKRKNDNEISVRAPDYIPKKKPIFKDTTGTEALDVFKVVQILGRILSFGMFAARALSIAIRRRKLSSGFGPERAATEIVLLSLENKLLRLASLAPFCRLI
mgnify:CR=1 FL=1